MAPRVTTVLDPRTLSPDPTLRHEPSWESPLQGHLDLEPASIVNAQPAIDSPWHCPITLKPDSQGVIDILLDFGTELDALLQITVTTTSLCNVAIYFGESVPEARGMILAHAPHPMLTWHLPSSGTHELRGDRAMWLDRPISRDTLRGFRFVRLVFQDVRDHLRIDRCVASARFAFQNRLGSFQCDDRKLQRAWHTSAYTARLCAQPDSLWDGIKRDRHGWFGDARITAQTNDALWLEPAPVAAMLALLPTDNWCNGVPLYSFDAIAMLHHHLLTYGIQTPGSRDAFEKVAAFLRWVAEHQSNEEGLVIRDGTKKIWTYFEEIGFLDWSIMPMGGRFEELCWLQCAYVQALRKAADIANWLGHPDDAAQWRARADRLSTLIIERCWHDGMGFVHTLNHAGAIRHLKEHYQKTYVENIKLGPSGPSRHSSALAVLAGLCTPAMKRTTLSNVFTNAEVTPIVTPYFRYYENLGRALCGDAIGALHDMTDYVGGLVEREDSATVWEFYDPTVTDIRKYSNMLDVTWHWSTSLCHGWSSGLVPLVQRFLLGVESVEPGFAKVRLDPATDARWSFDATIPTPQGPIRARRDAAGEPVIYTLPEGVEPLPAGPGVVVTQQ